MVLIPLFWGPRHLPLLLSWISAWILYGACRMNLISRSHDQYWHVPQYFFSACTDTVAIFYLADGWCYVVLFTMGVGFLRHCLLSLRRSSTGFSASDNGHFLSTAACRS